uniref:Uncharacterized protein n=1 Tax=Glossina austeni TaxID=7395 RepID=A0A1A9VX06_GLOAU
MFKLLCIYLPKLLFMPAVAVAIVALGNMTSSSLLTDNVVLILKIFERHSSDFENRALSVERSVKRDLRKYPKRFNSFVNSKRKLDDFQSSPVFAFLEENIICSMNE